MFDFALSRHSYSVCYPTKLGGGAGVHHLGSSEHHPVHDGEVPVPGGADHDRELGFHQADGDHPSHGGKVLLLSGTRLTSLVLSGRRHTRLFRVFSCVFVTSFVLRLVSGQKTFAEFFMIG